jgi:hypothetical protein
MRHHINPAGLPPTNGYSHAVSFTGLVHPAFRIEIEALATVSAR